MALDVAPFYSGQTDYIDRLNEIIDEASGTIDGCSDINLAGRSDGDLLSWDSATSKWILVAPAAGGATTLSALSDVTLTGLADKFILRYDTATSKWVAEKRNFYVTATVSGKPSAGFVYYADLPAGITIRFKAGLPGSTLKLKVAATASFVVTIKKDGTSIGTATVAAGDTTATASFTSDVDFTGNELSFTFPGSQDATAADVKISMAGEVV